ncbi:MAG: DUF4468 domain-containing protein [Mucilaginibacter polytrichastri]|nr:DUF4468 domain-containing protein [Mucilaginibacter polytrichastri]
MKCFAVFVFVFILSLRAFSQNLPVDDATKKISYQGIVVVDGATEKQLYDRARSWFATKFRFPRDVVQMDDKEAGKIIARCELRGPQNADSPQFWFMLRYSIIVVVRNGKYRYEITDFTQQPDPYYDNRLPEEIGAEFLLDKDARNARGELREKHQDYYKALTSRATQVVNSLKDAMKQPVGTARLKEEF